MQPIKMATAAINKIHVNNSTKMSLNDRFTVISSKPLPAPLAAARRRSFYRASKRDISSDLGSIRNRRLLAQLARKHKMVTALKLKRRSMRTYGASMAFRRANNGITLKRGTIKALRVAPNGSPIKANSLSNVATMKADLMGRLNTRRSRSNLAGRLGSINRGGIGGARRSPSRRRLTLGRTGTRFGGGSISANRRSRSRSRLAPVEVISDDNMPVRSRLGIKPSTAIPRKAAGFPRSSSRGRRRGSVNRIARGRVQKSRVSQTPLRRFRGSSRPPIGGARAGRLRGRSDSKINPIRGRSRSSMSRSGRRPSRSRSQARTNIAKRPTSTQRQPNFRRGGGVGSGRLRRGRSQQRGRGGASGTQRKGNGQQQERRGRSRSRGRGRQLAGRSPKVDLKREDLDKELDQYMATTKTENNMDYLLRD